MISYLNTIYIFGGEIGFNETIKIREVSNSLYCWDKKTQNLIGVKTYNTPEARRNFASAVVGNKFMSIYGGINEHGKYLNDICFLNLGIF